MAISTMSQAMQLHAQILKSGSPENKTRELSKVFTFSALSGNLSYARLVLDTLPTPLAQRTYFHNTLIRAFSGSPEPTHALSLFLSMHQDFPVRPDKFTFPFALKACTRLRQTRMGKQLHGLIFKSSLGSDRFIQNSLIHLYSGCGECGVAERVFDKMSERDVVSWTSMIDGLADNGRYVKALKLFKRMLDDGVEPNDATVVTVLRACADTGALSLGERVHGIVEEIRIGFNVHVKTALIDMYAKCGRIECAMQVFDGVGDKDVFTWTAMISGLACHGMCRDAITMFDKMEQFGLKPDEKTMTAVLSACRNLGLVSEGLGYFNSMENKYGVKPTIQHYGCIVDLFARSGRLDDAEEFIKKMPIKPDAAIWRALLWACKNHNDNTDRSERLMKHLKLDAGDCGSYVLLGNVFASMGKWQDKGRVRRLMSHQGLVKPPGSSKIELDGVIHEFTAGDSSHAEAEKIYEKLDEMEAKMSEEGHCPNLADVLLDIDDEEKASQLRHHSERLAVAYGLVRSSPGAEIRIVKNLRSCEDCHSAMKLISKLYQRKIVVRDRIRFHHFEDGECSCRDYW